jgi:drug/metabolite transporter (DMT)-like permease
MPFGLVFALKYDYSQATLGAWFSVVYMAIGLSGFVYVLWYWLLKYLEASRIAVYHNVQPIIASFVAYAFLGESLSTVFLVGGAIVIAGVIVTET